MAIVDQTATQSNSDSQTITQSGCTDCRASNDSLFNQENQADQDGLAVAVAASGNVTVVQKGGVSAAEDGIDAESNAVAVAKVNQDVEQNNEFSQSITQEFPETLAQPVEPENAQEAATIAVALSDEVSVKQEGDVSAGEDGVKGISSAVAVAIVDQTSNQYIEQFASTAAVAISDKVDVSVSGNVNAGDDGVVGVSSAVAIAEGGSSPIDMAALEERYQGQALDQLSLPTDLDALAVAVADEVNVTTYGNISAGGSGVVAVSFAKARAEGDNAAAIAVSDDVNVQVNGNIWAQKTGIFAASIADADLAVNSRSSGRATSRLASIMAR